MCVPVNRPMAQVTTIQAPNGPRQMTQARAEGKGNCAERRVRSADQAGNPAEQPDMRQVIPSGEDEQAGEQGDARAEPVFLRALR